MSDDYTPTPPPNLLAISKLFIATLMWFGIGFLVTLFAYVFVVVCNLIGLHP